MWNVDMWEYEMSTCGMLTCENLRCWHVECWHVRMWDVSMWENETILCQFSMDLRMYVQKSTTHGFANMRCVMLTLRTCIACCQLHKVFENTCCIWLDVRYAWTWDCVHATHDWMLGIHHNKHFPYKLRCSSHYNGTEDSEWNISKYINNTSAICLCHWIHVLDALFCQGWIPAIGAMHPASNAHCTHVTISWAKVSMTPWLTIKSSTMMSSPSLMCLSPRT